MNLAAWAGLLVAAIAVATVIWQGGKMAAILEQLTEIARDLDRRQREDHDAIVALQRRR